MTTKKADEARDVYQIKVTLVGTKPSIWRRLLVSADISLARFHVILQIAMGWEDSHLHEFRVGQRRFGPPEPADPLSGVPRLENEGAARLSGVLAGVGATMAYLYDFGDHWEHRIVLEGRILADSNAIYPVCTDGRLACPPEDCGGIPGFYELLDALGDPGHERHHEISAWIGDGFEAQLFSIQKINGQLASTRQRRPAR